MKINEFIPKSLIEVAINPQKLEVVSFNDQELNALTVVIVEHDYVMGEAEEREWNQYLEAMNEAEKQEADEIGNRFFPDPPTGKNRLRAKFLHYINSGRLSQFDRIMMTCELRIISGSVNILFVSNYDGETSMGIASDFYSKVLPTLAKRVGVRIIAGVNTSTNLSFFRDKLGRFTFKQLKPEAKGALLSTNRPSESDEEFTTIQFLEETDVEKYVLADAIKAKHQ